MRHTPFLAPSERLAASSRDHRPSSSASVFASASFAASSADGKPELGYAEKPSAIFADEILSNAALGIEPWKESSM